MPLTTTVLPIDQIDPIRESLLATHGELVEEVGRLEGRGTSAAAEALARARARLDALEQVLGQVGWTAEQFSAPREVTGQSAVLWAAAYDIVCAAAERLAEICTAYWLGSVAPTEVYAGLADLSARFELLESLGPPQSQLREADRGG